MARIDINRAAYMQPVYVTSKQFDKLLYWAKKQVRIKLVCDHPIVFFPYTEKVAFTLAKELGTKGITVNSVMPGIIGTESNAGWLIQK